MNMDNTASSAAQASATTASQEVSDRSALPGLARGLPSTACRRSRETAQAVPAPAAVTHSRAVAGQTRSTVTSATASVLVAAATRIRRTSSRRRPLCLGATGAAGVAFGSHRARGDGATGCPRRLPGGDLEHGRRRCVEPNQQAQVVDHRPGGKHDHSKIHCGLTSGGHPAEAAPVPVDARAPLTVAPVAIAGCSTGLELARSASRVQTDGPDPTSRSPGVSGGYPGQARLGYPTLSSVAHLFPST